MKDSQIIDLYTRFETVVLSGVVVAGAPISVQVFLPDFVPKVCKVKGITWYENGSTDFFTIVSSNLFSSNYSSDIIMLPIQNGATFFQLDERFNMTKPVNGQYTFHFQTTNGGFSAVTGTFGIILEFCA